MAKERVWKEKPETSYARLLTGVAFDGNKRKEKIYTHQNIVVIANFNKKGRKRLKILI